jgi:Zn-dependent protease
VRRLTPVAPAASRAYVPGAMERVERVLVFLPVLLISVVLHEVAHGWVALKQGDETAKRAGRLTLNPIPHIDVLGSVVVPTVLALMPGGLLFGWAKPVPVDPRNFRNLRRGDILVSLAGIAANLLLVVVFTALMVVAASLPRDGAALTAVADTVYRMGGLGVILNLILAFFNLIPLPPLDGSHVVAQLLPGSLRARYHALGRYGLGILLLLIFLAPGALEVLLWPAFALTDMAFAVVDWLV